jgi:murein endopeptidase
MGQPSQLQPQDSRRYFMLPQAPEEAGYYVYGTPVGGAFQYAHPLMMTALLWVEREWAAIDNRKFGVGNISLAGGTVSGEHHTHIDGLQVDVRALRKDGLHLPVTWHDHEYDREATGRLIGFFFSYPAVKTVLFNDVGVHPGVQPWDDHDNHFHVALRLPRSK